MNGMNFRLMIDEAQSALATYRNPDVSECKERLNEIIVAANLGDIKKDRLAFVTIRDGCVVVRTEYSVRGCEQSDDFEFPAWIIDRDDPVKAAKSWGLESRVTAARNKIADAKRHLAGLEEELEAAKAALTECHS